MEPSKDEDAIVDLLDVVLRDGAVVRADVIVSVADVPLVGIKLTAAIAGMETMTEYGLFEEWDARRRKAAIARRQYDADNESAQRESAITVGSSDDGNAKGDEPANGDNTAKRDDSRKANGE